MRVITPEGKIRDLKAGDPEIDYFLSTEGQMGIIVKATLRVGQQPSQWYPFVIPFEEPASAYAFTKRLSLHPSIKPDDLIVYHSDWCASSKHNPTEECPLRMEIWSWLFLQMLRKPASSRHIWVNMEFKLRTKNQQTISGKSGSFPCPSSPWAPLSWPPRWFSLWIRWPPTIEKISEWGKRLGVTLYPTSHLVRPGQVLFLAMIATDHRKPFFMRTSCWSR